MPLSQLEFFKPRRLNIAFDSFYIAIPGRICRHRPGIAGMFSEIRNFVAVKPYFRKLKNPQNLIPAFLFLVVLLGSCASYKMNIMFKPTDSTVFQKQIETIEKNYVIQVNDFLQLEVYTNKGERIIDPDLQLRKETGSQQYYENDRVPSYLVDVNGISKFPMIGELKVAGLKLREAEAILEKEYATYYQGSFVVLKYMNKRAIVLGATGGQVIPLANENMTLVEIIALAKGLHNDAMAQNIRILRKDKVFLADLSTIEGYLKNNMVIEPGDIVYVEPIRRPFLEGLRDYGIVISVVSTLTTLVVVLVKL